MNSKVQTNNCLANVGCNSAAVVDVVTKSGTNRIHGSAFECGTPAWTGADASMRAEHRSPFRYTSSDSRLGGPVYRPNTVKSLVRSTPRPCSAPFRRPPTEIG